MKPLSINFSRFFFSLALTAATSGLEAAAQSGRAGMGSIVYADQSGTGTMFRVWAPNATNVQVVGDFNGWNLGANPLVSEGASGNWSADITSANVGDEYQYVINGTLWRRDPRARRVTNSSGNSIIYDWYAFDWGSYSYTPPSREDIVIYQMHPGTFNAESWIPGTFDKNIERLDHVRNLGISMIKLMPVNEFASDKSWGYNPSDVFAIESAYGGPDALKRFIRASHERGMGIAIDVVHNHYGPSDLGMWQFDGWSANNLGGIYFYNDWRANTPWGDTRPDFWKREVRDFIKDHIRMFANEYRVDGFRWDSVYNIAYIGWPPGPNDDGITLLEQINWDLSQNHPHIFRVAEDHAFDFNMNFQGLWNVAWRHEVAYQLTRGSDAERDMHTVKRLLDEWPSHNRVLFTEAHDYVARVNGKNRMPADIHYADPESIWARKRALLGGAIVMTAPGTPMIFQGQEMHETWGFHDDTALRWSLTNQYAGIVQAYSDLIHARRNLRGGTQGLRGTGINVHHVDNVNKVVAFTRWYHGGGSDDVVVVANFGAQVWNQGNYWIQFPSEGTWYSHFNSDAGAYQPDFGNVGNTQVSAAGSPPAAAINMGMYGVQIFSKTPPVAPGSASIFPDPVIGCATVTITYWPGTGPLSGAGAVNAFIGHNGWNGVENYPMTSNGEGGWTYTYTVPSETEIINVVFNDGGDIWDNNEGRNWSFSVMGCGLQVPSEVIVDPAQPNGCEPVTITYRPNNGPLEGEENITLVIGRNGGQNWVGLPMTGDGHGGFTATYDVLDGTYIINFVFNNGEEGEAGIWDNNNGGDWNIAIANCAVANYPTILITNPANDFITVPAGTPTFALQGRANTAAVGRIVWSNTLTGASGDFAAATRWTLPGVALAVGYNVITVTATGLTASVAAWDNAGEPVYTNGIHGSSGGSGFGGPWEIFTFGENAGNFIAEGQGNQNIPGKAFGLWANSGSTVEAHRPFAAALVPGDAFHMDFENNSVDSSGGYSVGFGLLNSANQNLFEFMFIGGQTNYIINDIALGRQSTVPWTGDGLNLHFRLIDNNLYELDVSGHTITGSLATVSDRSITSLKVWNYSSGGGYEHNLYFNNLSVTSAPGNRIASASDTLTIFIEGDNPFADDDNDGIPNSWEILHFGSATGAVASADSDGDGMTNWQEYISDTNPNDGTSYTRDIIGTAGMHGQTTSITIGPRTTNSRRYNIIWTPTLQPQTWSSFNLNQPGRDDGGPLTLTVTNPVDNAFYRTRISTF